MNTTFIAMAIAALAGIGLVVTIGVLSLTSGALHWLFARPRIEFLKSEHGDHGFAFSFSWNASMEPAKFDIVKVRLFNPFGTPTQVEVSRQFPAAGDNFARDAYMGNGMKRILEAEGLESATVEVEVISSKDSVSQIFNYKGSKFVKMVAEAVDTVKAFEAALPAPAGKPIYTTVQRSFIAEPMPQSSKTIKLATNPEFAGDFAAAGGAGGEAQANFEVSKVWIEPGCIVCNACEAIAPDVFEVTDDSCIIRPGAPLNDGLLIAEASDACPVEVIKFNKVG